MVSNKELKMKMKYYCLLIIWLGCSSIQSLNAAEHNHAAMTKNTTTSEVTKCIEKSVICAKTVTTAFAPNGDLWRLWSVNHYMYYQVSKDNGKIFSAIKRVNIAPENILARNENRPKIAFDQHKGVYISWAISGKKRFTGDIRFSYSSDNGFTFREPVTVNNDGIVTGHSFNEMIVSPTGDVSIVWLDSRYTYQQRKAGKTTNGSELYLAKGNPRENSTFSNEALARGTCVCCRIAIDLDDKGNLAIFWRHIFGDNIREFALVTLDKARPELRKVNQISDDHWHIEGCPHQGGGISIDAQNRYHLIWYNQGDKGKGIFYAYSDDAGNSLTNPIPIGINKRQAAHPHLNQRNDIVDIVWTQFDGKVHRLWHQQSTDRGKSFKQASVLGQSTSGSDRPFIVSKGNKSIVSWHRFKTGHWVSEL